MQTTAPGRSTCIHKLFLFNHFGRSEERLSGNAAKARIIIDEINALESLAEQLRELASCFQGDALVIETAEVVVQQEAPEEMVENTETEPS